MAVLGKECLCSAVLSSTDTESGWAADIYRTNAQGSKELEKGACPSWDAKVVTALIQNLSVKRGRVTSHVTINCNLCRDP